MGSPEIFSFNTLPIEAGLVIPYRITKRWGYELIYANHDNTLSSKHGSKVHTPLPYCMKLIFIHEGKTTSMHFHARKHETILVADGHIRIDFKDTKAEVLTRYLVSQEAIVIPPGFQHKITGVKESTLVEASTHDYPHDSFRVSM